MLEVSDYSFSDLGHSGSSLNQEMASGTSLNQRLDEESMNGNDSVSSVSFGANELLEENGEASKEK